jgi:predicted  nucleic acid-binding Zn-ribbon protein
MDFEKKIEELSQKIDHLVERYQAVNAHNINLRRSLEEKEKEILKLQEEVSKLKLEKKEAVKRLDSVIEKITKYFEEKGSESLL